MHWKRLRVPLPCLSLGSPLGWVEVHCPRVLSPLDAHVLPSSCLLCPLQEDSPMIPRDLRAQGGGQALALLWTETEVDL